MSVGRLRISGIFLFITGILVACNIYTLIPLYGAIGSEMGIPGQQVANGSTFFTLFYAFGLLIFGPVSDQVGRKKIIVGGLIFSALTTFLVVLANVPIELFLYRGLQGFTLASFAPVTFLYVFELFSGKERTMWLALINTGFLMAGILGQLASSSMLAIGTWHSVYILFSFLYILLFLLNSVILPKTKVQSSTTHPTDILRGMVTVLKNREMQMMYMIVFSILFAFVSFYEAWGYQSSGESNMMMLRGIGLFGAILSVFTGIFIERFGAVNTLFVGIILGWGSIFILMFVHDEGFLSLISVFFVSSIALLIPTIIHLIGGKSGILRGKALSLYSFILLLGASFGSFMASLLSYKAMLTMILGFFTLDLLLAYQIGRKEKSLRIKQEFS